MEIPNDIIILAIRYVDPIMQFVELWQIFNPKIHGQTDNRPKRREHPS